MTMHANGFGFWFGRKKKIMSNHDETGYDAKRLLKQMIYQEGIKIITTKQFIHTREKKIKSWKAKRLSL